jgi:rhamnosyltransferase
MISASIIIRAKNESRWLPRCLTMIQKQTFKDFEIILVDNQSTDGTLEVARSFGVSKLLTIENYSPGRSLNLAAQEANGKYLVFLSAHCVPYNEHWLQELLNGFTLDSSICGVYGRQIPLPDSEAGNSRDLLSIFRDESRLQKSDYFFHNANSAIKYDEWNRNKFDPDLGNLEDQAWAKTCIDSGGTLYYQSKSIVYHHDGLHFSQSAERTSGVVRVLKNLERLDLKQVPMHSSLRMSSCYTFCLFDDESNSEIIREVLDNYVTFVRQVKSVLNIQNVIVTSKAFLKLLEKKLTREELSSLILIDRSLDEVNLSRERDILEILEIMTAYLKSNVFKTPEAVFFYNPQYSPPSKTNLINLIVQYCLSDVDLVVLGKRIKGLTWVREPNGDFRSTESSLIPGKKRESVYEVNLGAGSLISVHAIDSRKLYQTKDIRIIELPELSERVNITHAE